MQLTTSPSGPRACHPRLARLPLAPVLGWVVPVAVGRRVRLLGLAGIRRDEAGSGLLLPGCRAVHTMGMRFALDLVFLDRSLRPVEIHRGVPPRRLAFVPGAGAVLELPAAGGAAA